MKTYGIKNNTITILSYYSKAEKEKIIYNDGEIFIINASTKKEATNIYEKYIFNNFLKLKSAKKFSKREYNKYKECSDVGHYYIKEYIKEVRNTDISYLAYINKILEYNEKVERHNKVIYERRQEQLKQQERQKILNLFREEIKLKYKKEEKERNKTIINKFSIPKRVENFSTPIHIEVEIKISEDYLWKTEEEEVQERRNSWLYERR